MSTHPSNAPEVFVSYSSKDKHYKDDLLLQLNVLAEQGVISAWHDGSLVPGQQWNSEIVEHLNSSRVILLLISPEFLSSDYVKSVELKMAAARHQRKEACVISVLLRNVNSWQGYPFGDLKLGDLQAVPLGAKFVVDWPNPDSAFAAIASGIQLAVEQLDLKDTVLGNPRIPPPPIVEFVARKGRDGRYLLDLLKSELTQPERRLIALSGEGGVGKTTIAAEVARSLTGAFAGRLVWASAEKRVDFALSTMLDEIATQLGDKSSLTLAIEEKENAVAGLLAEAPALVVLDNFETVSPAGQPLCERFLKEKAPCSALITSRQRLPSARNYPVDGMSPDEAEEFLGRLVLQMQDPSIFSEPVRKQIVETADARPYVMEWVVAQIDQRAEEPATVLDELSRGEGDAAERIFDHSFNLPQTGEDGQAALLALSLFVPSASREGLALVAGFGEDKDRLDSAVRILRALLLVKGVDENRRLTVEGLTRSLARVRWNKDERREDLRSRFVEYFLGYAEAHARPTPEDYEALELEKYNLIYAIDLASESNDWTSVMAIRSALEEFLDVHGYWEDAIRSGRQALDSARLLGSDASVSQFAHNLGIIYQHRGEIEEARQLYQESLDIKKKLGKQSGIANSLHELGRLAQSQGEIEEARRLYQESLDIAKKLGDQGGIANTLNQLAMLAQSQGEVEEARRFYQESLDIKKKLGKQSGIANSLHNLGTLAQDQGELEEARRLYQEGLDIAKKLGDQRVIASTLHQLGRLAQDQGEVEGARRLYQESLDIKKKLGNKSGIANSLHQLGRLAEGQGDFGEAQRLFSEALAIFERLKSPNADIARRCLERVKGKVS
jgi:tetratricopeptide (TPR) repeat protein